MDIARVAAATCDVRQAPKAISYAASRLGKTTKVSTVQLLRRFEIDNGDKHVTIFNNIGNSVWKWALGDHHGEKRYARREIFAAAGGAALLGFAPMAKGAASRTLEDTPSGLVQVDHWGVAADGVVDDTDKIQAVIDANPGATIVFMGTSAISAITVRGDNTRLIFRNGGGFAYTEATARAITVSGNNVVIEELNLVGPGTFDATNEEPNYGMIWVTGDNCKILGGRLTNVPKVGVMFSECEGGFVSKLTIQGNFPNTSFTGTEVAHAGVLINCKEGGREGNFLIESNDISTCVQGVLIANYGPTSRSQGIIITGNNFWRCWNHGVYGAGINYSNSVTSNIFINCQVAIALSGSYHVVTDNNITTGVSLGNRIDEVGISLRDPIHCMVANNVLQGETGANQVVINLATSLNTIVRGNVVSGNTMNIEGRGSANLIRLGGMDCTDLKDNQVIGNTCIGIGREQSGLILLVGAANCHAHGTIVSSNSAVAKSASHGIQLVNVVGASIVHNRVRIEYNSESRVQIAGIVCSACSACEFVNNTMTTLVAQEGNINLVGLWEVGGSSRNRASNNVLNVDLTKFAYVARYMTESTSSIIIDDFGSGAPDFNAGVGSIGAEPTVKQILRFT